MIWLLILGKKSTGFVLRSDPCRRVPRSGLAGPERRPRVLRSSLAEPERRLARWGASMSPTQVVVFLLPALALRRLVVH